MALKDAERIQGRLHLGGRRVSGSGMDREKTALFCVVGAKEDGMKEGIQSTKPVSSSII